MATVTVSMDRERRLADILDRANVVSAIVSIEREGVVGAVELAELMGGNKAMGRPMMDHLEKHGIVEVTEGLNIFRAKTFRIKLTPEGQRLAAALRRTALVLDEKAPAGREEVVKKEKEAKAAREDIRGLMRDVDARGKRRQDGEG